MRLVGILAAAFALALAGCGSEGGGRAGAGERTFAEHASHIHGLGVNPADRSLVIATHNGLFRARAGSRTALPVGDSAQDTMGFTVAGPNRFLASGHPAPDEGGPPHLGLIESRDAGMSWREVSLGGRADFHVLRFAHNRIYGFNGLSGQLMISDDGGETWDSARLPIPVFDLVVDPADRRHVIGSSEVGLIESRDDGASWERRSSRVGLLAWPAPRSLYLFEAAGSVLRREEPGRPWDRRGRLPEGPVAVLATSEDTLFAALASGVILHSDDGGASWRERVVP